jgi:hypothetical protein
MPRKHPLRQIVAALPVGLLTVAGTRPPIRNGAETGFGKPASECVSLEA